MTAAPDKCHQVLELAFREEHWVLGAMASVQFAPYLLCLQVDAKAPVTMKTIWISPEPLKQACPDTNHGHQENIISCMA